MMSSFSPAANKDSQFTHLPSLFMITVRMMIDQDCAFIFTKIINSKMYFIISIIKQLETDHYHHTVAHDIKTASIHSKGACLYPPHMPASLCVFLSMLLMAILEYYFQLAN